MTMTVDSLATVRTVGGLLPPDLLARVAAGTDLGGLGTADYHLERGDSPREAANRAWAVSLAAWRAFRRSLDALPDSDRATTLTRDRWLSILFRELAFDETALTPAGGLQADERSFPVSHLDGIIPLHWLGWRVDDLDDRSPGVAGAAGLAPHAMVQDLLNRSDAYPWAFVSNGRILRLLHNSSTFVGPSYVEFDLEAMFDGEVFSDFVVLYLTCHRSRFQPIDPTTGAEDWLERWRRDAVETGIRAEAQLRIGVKDAMESLGSGFLRHPGNEDLRRRVASGELPIQDLHHALLRVVYRLVFCFVAEDRGLLLRPEATPVARARFQEFFSTRRLRHVARRRHGSRHTDLWQTVSLLFDLLGRPQACSQLGIDGIGGLFEPTATDVVSDCQLTNEALLTAVRCLSIVTPPKGPRRIVDYRNLGSEELGSVYESLLELVPRHDAETQTFALDDLKGNLRKTSGTYYTPTVLIDALLNSALDPLLDAADNNRHPETALLAITVCDPACGSGHFLVAAGKRIAARLARHRSDGNEPSLVQGQTALRDVVRHCLYGVDVDPMAIELTKINLWLEAVEPGRPLTFLDAHLKVGNALLGTTPALLAEGIPDDAFAAITGDDKKHASALRTRNRRSREGQGSLFAPTTWLTERAGVLDALPAESLADVQVAARRQRELDDEPELQRAKLLADAWCAAFVAVKQPGRPEITNEVLDRWQSGDLPDVDAIRVEVERLARQYRFLHWHLEFPQIFSVPDTELEDGVAGWSGGFTCVVGNPPWDHVELKEQEFFASLDPDIAEASGAARKSLIKALPETNPVLWQRFDAARRQADGERHFLGSSTRFPLCGRGRINTYAVFAETDRLLIEPHGRVGAVLPTGIATDATTQYFFADLMQGHSLVSLYDFENARPLFEGVHRSFKFSLVTMSGPADPIDSSDFAFFCHHPDHLSLPDVRFTLTPAEIALLNPNTGTCPIPRSRRDAEITLGIYRRVPILVHEHDPDGNPWDVSFMQGLFNMTSASHLFRTRAQLEGDDWHLEGNTFSRGNERMLPLYEAKMIHHYDHRWATYVDDAIRDTTLAEHQDPLMTALPRYWAPDEDVDKRLAGHETSDWLSGFRNVCRSTDERTMVIGSIGRVAVGHSLPLLFGGPSIRPLVTMLSSLASDYVIRQKVGGINMTFNYVRQFPLLPPSSFQDQCLWKAGSTLDRWLDHRSIELSYTAWDMEPFARERGDVGNPFRWDVERRAQLRAELDGAFFHLYGLDRSDTDYILGTFPILNRQDLAKHGEERTRRLVLAAYDGISSAIASGDPFVSPLHPAPGDGPRHPAR
jgi:hypothetical protein